MAASAAGRCLRLGLRAAGSLITQQGPLGCREALSDTWVSAAAFSRRPSAGAAGWRRYTSAAQAETWDTFRQTFCSIQVEVGEDGVAVLTLDRPEALNALNAKVGAAPRVWGAVGGCGVLGSPASLFAPGTQLPQLLPSCTAHSQQPPPCPAHPCPCAWP